MELSYLNVNNFAFSWHQTDGFQAFEARPLAESAEGLF